MKEKKVKGAKPAKAKWGGSRNKGMRWKWGRTYYRRELDMDIEVCKCGTCPVCLNRACSIRWYRKQQEKVKVKE